MSANSARDPRIRERTNCGKCFMRPVRPRTCRSGNSTIWNCFPDRPSQGRLQELRKEVEQWRISGTGARPARHALVDRPEPLGPRIFLRGNPNQPGPAVARRMPAAIFPAAPAFRDGGGRLELARAIAAPDNPLTARVLVNRVWQHHFGRGLVTTPSDFGVRSDPPSHPELLDHLATEFRRGGWSIKKLHRMILLSATYQQRSDDCGDCSKIDPENRLLWKMPRNRLDFEATRDNLLAVSGRLDAKIGGPSTRDILSPASTGRTLYGFVDRLQVPGLYRAFDFPSPDATNPQRDATTIPQQALYLMNSPFAAECAGACCGGPMSQSINRTRSAQSPACFASATGASRLPTKWNCRDGF